jgi:hypothetical protein
MRQEYESLFFTRLGQQKRRSSRALTASSVSGGGASVEIAGISLERTVQRPLQREQKGMLEEKPDAGKLIS